MPELPEVENVRRRLLKQVKNMTITDLNVLHKNIISEPNYLDFKNKIINQKIEDIKRKGKLLIFVLTDYVLLSHLRMEGRYYLKEDLKNFTKHEHVIFTLDNKYTLRYIDTRKFGRMYLQDKSNYQNKKPYIDLGSEPWDIKKEVLKEKIGHKKLPIKTILLDQGIISGIGNIYADEILFASSIYPLTKGLELSDKDIDNIILNASKILKESISMGGTTIHSFEIEEGKIGSYQNKLMVHTKKTCSKCESEILKIKVGGRGTYYCPNCQKKPIQK